MSDPVNKTMLYRGLADEDAAELASLNGYVKPEINDGRILSIKGGRHPVIEGHLGRDRFIPNELSLDDSHRLLIITCPNMAGKST